MGEARSLTRLTVFIENGEFILMDVEGDAGLPPGAPDPRTLSVMSTTWLTAGANAAVISSDFDVHTADVVVEVWSGEPPVDPTPQSDVSEAIFTSSSGTITFDEVTGTDEDYPEIHLGLPGDYHIRVIRRRLRSEDPTTLVAEFEGLEFFCIQLWRL
ncbi:hypothetical protein [Microbispora catharanthi]|uniref:Uncharacterized protein n=1 Tax=Microbispora catharanthi TaxID=1712871 RepID=A0A5N6BZS6_9ACTN|nr:hypothetical protein [Microbispora catharanthi]KAB8186034.1 hypothetical protein FH610_009825 [Microbispora catharanthi]